MYITKWGKKSQSEKATHILYDIMNKGNCTESRKISGYQGSGGERGMKKKSTEDLGALGLDCML